jgi:hypothetical protein
MGYFGPTFGRPVPEVDPWLTDDVERNADMRATADESREDVLALYRRAWAVTDATVVEPPLEALCAGELRGQPHVVVADRATVGEQLAVVVEEDDAVAEQPPPLLGVVAHHGGQVTGLADRIGTRVGVGTHGHHFRPWTRRRGRG